jgi:hypothetical protein
MDMVVEDAVVVEVKSRTLTQGGIRRLVNGFPE